MSSKKKRRREKWLEREKVRKAERDREERINDAMRSGTMKDLADAMGVPLK